jgi:hypothetical protein
LGFDFFALPALASEAGAAGVAAVAGVAGVAGVAAVPAVGSAGVAGVAGIAGEAGVAAGCAESADPTASETPASARWMSFISISFQGFSGGKENDRSGHSAELDGVNRRYCRRAVVPAGFAAAPLRR